VRKIALIPARGGSKRIPRKNIKLFCGKPVVAYSIEAARDSGLFDHIVVSTDDEEIASVVTGLGAEVPFVRPVELANDHVGLLPVLRHALMWFESHGEPIDFICSIMATAPMLGAEVLTDSFNAMLSMKASGATGVATFPSSIFRAFKVNGAGTLEMVWPENYPKRSQDFPEVFHDAGQFTWFRVCDFPTNSLELPKNIIPVVLPRNQVQDIDTPEDWQMAEQMYRYRASTESAANSEKSHDSSDL